MADKIALCAIGRLENLYAREWVEHHLRIGFDHIIIYDNNREGEEHFEEVLQDYVDSRKATVIDYRDRDKAQRSAYNDCYSCYGTIYDWLAFFDFDEFLFINKTLPQDVHELMRRYDGWQAVMVPWLMMTDSGLLHYDPRPITVRFTECSPVHSNQAKGIVRGGIRGLRYTKSVHVPKTPELRCCDTLGNPTAQARHASMNTEVCWLAHYSTKTAEEWVTNKWKKGAAGVAYDTFCKQYKDYFFSINERTKEKEEIINGKQSNCK